MIKIQISDRETLKSEYLAIIKQEVIDALSLMKLSFEHLSDHTSIKDADRVKVKTFTKNIVDTIREPKTTNGYFNRDAYRNGVQNYLTGAKIIHKVNLIGLANLVTHLLDVSNEKLDEILVGNPETLKQTSDALLKDYRLTTKQELDILKLGFNYGGNTAELVKDFIYDKKLTTYCPYCNLNRARNTKNKVTGKTADQVSLDHFFDKDNNPLLGLSLFNLIPSDTNCNGINKHTKPFSDKLHLNPYISGFKRTMVFEPIFVPLSENVIEVELKITVDRTSQRHFQLIGDCDKRDQEEAHGNLNVFQIYTKYNDDEVHRDATRLFKNFRKTAINEQALQEILNEMDTLDPYDNFKGWYENLTGTRFHEKEFGLKAYSKFNRDLLDFVYSQYNKAIHDQVKTILENSYLPEKGGE